MAYGPSRTSALQTAYNAAATIVAAELSAGLIASSENVLVELAALKDTIFGEISAVVEEEDVSAAVNSGTYGLPNGGGSSRGFNPPSSKDEALNTKLTFGKFKGLTIGETMQLSDQQAAGYGYVDKAGNPKTGLQWLEWVSKNDKPEAARIRAAAEMALN
jgi:hypothetical protein